MTMQTFSTTDYGICCYAVAIGARLTRVDRGEKKAVFVLESPEGEQEIADKYWSNSTVRIIDFLNAQRNVKQRLFSTM